MTKTNEFGHAELTLQLTGLTPLLLHNARLADPTDEWSRRLAEVTARRKAKSIDMETAAAEIARVEFLGGLYWSDDVGVYLPGYNVARSVMEGGSALGRKGSAVDEALVDYSDTCPVQPYSSKYDDAASLFEDGHRLTVPVKIGASSTVMRTRPHFHPWVVHWSVTLDTARLSVEEFLAAADYAGRYKGVGDGRKRGYRKGRYLAEVVA